MASKKRDLSKLDLYGILGVSEEATEKEIVKAYRKQALKCHPDKNPDNPKAADEFHQLAEALEILTDAAAKAQYDKILKAKKAAELRQKKFDSKRKKFKDDLEAREQAVNLQKDDSVAAARRLQAEIERLRKEGSRILEEAQEQLRKDLEEKEQLAAQQQDTKSKWDSEPEEEEEASSPKLKVKWKIRKGEDRDEGYTKQEMTDMFSKYGDILNLVMSIKKSGTAIIEYSSSYSGELAVQNVTGKPEFPLTVSWLSGQPPTSRLQPDTKQPDTTQQQAAPVPTTFTSFTSFTQASGGGGAAPAEERDFESVVLMKMRQAEERKRLIQQMMAEDEQGS